MTIQLFEEQQSRRIVQLLRDAGAKEVHVAIGSPELKYPCFYGIDIQTRRELISANHSVDEVCEIIGADSLTYLSLDGLIDSIGIKQTHQRVGSVWRILMENFQRPFMTMRKNIFEA